MPTLLLATFELVPTGEAGADLLVEAFARRGVRASWAVWSDAGVDWAAADAVVVRSTWDYHRRYAEFLAWARRVEAVTRLVPDTDVLAWNGDKRYLLDLAEHVPVVPTRSVEADGLVAGLAAGLADHGSVVIKPRVGASGVGLVVAGALDDHRLATLTAGPWIVQPVVESVRTEGETSVYVFGGAAVSQLRKTPPAADIRVQEEHGGTTAAVDLDPAAVSLAERTVAVAAKLLGRTPSYARVDLLRWEGDLVVSELELIEPGLYLDLAPQNVEAFAAHVLD